MFKHYFELVHNVAVWPVISMFVFLTFFIGLTIYVIMADKKFISDMSQMPIDDPQDKTNGSQSKSDNDEN